MLQCFTILLLELFYNAHISQNVPNKNNYGICRVVPKIAGILYWS